MDPGPEAAQSRESQSERRVSEEGNVWYDLNLRHYPQFIPTRQKLVIYRHTFGICIANSTTLLNLGQTNEQTNKFGLCKRWMGFR